MTGFASLLHRIHRLGFEVGGSRWKSVDRSAATHTLPPTPTHHPVGVWGWWVVAPLPSLGGKETGWRWGVEVGGS
jgi:hypothetical protein